jgi:hypothetical protein
MFVKAMLLAAAMAITPTDFPAMNSPEWRKVPDLEMRVASRLQVGTVVTEFQGADGIMYVIHRIGRTYIRIISIDGEVYYSYWIDEDAVLAQR